MSQTSSSKNLIQPYHLDLWHEVAFTTVNAGNMSTTVLAESETPEETKQHRRAVEEALGITPGTTRFVSQIHSTTVVEAGPDGWESQPTLGDADAIVSVSGTAPMAILVADCMPIAFSTDYGPAAIAHAGRVGLLGGILEKTVERLRALDRGGRGRIKAVIGPSICGSCYEVPAEMRQQAAHHYSNIASETTWGTPALDLPAAAEGILEAADVEVYRINDCTFTNEQFYSHRRQPGAGRIAGFVWKSTKTRQ